MNPTVLLLAVYRAVGDSADAYAEALADHLRGGRQVDLVALSAALPPHQPFQCCQWCRWPGGRWSLQCDDDDGLYLRRYNDADVVSEAFCLGRPPQ